MHSTNFEHYYTPRLSVGTCWQVRHFTVKLAVAFRVKSSRIQAPCLLLQIHSRQSDVDPAADYQAEAFSFHPNLRKLTVPVGRLLHVTKQVADTRCVLKVCSPIHIRQWDVDQTAQSWEEKATCLHRVHVPKLRDHHPSDVDPAAEAQILEKHWRLRRVGILVERLQGSPRLIYNILMQRCKFSGQLVLDWRSSVAIQRFLFLLPIAIHWGHTDASVLHQ